jgi:hypothetical protein
VTAALRGWLASRIAMPWLFSDELVHSELAKGVANGSLFEIRGQHVNVTYAYPFVLAPAWLLSSMGATYAVAKGIGVVLMSAAALPVYLWGRRFMTPIAAAGAAVLTLVLPELALTGALMQENLAFPAFLAAAFALAVALEEPTAARQALLLVAIAVAATARFELLVLVPIVPTAVVLFARAGWRRYAGVLVPTVGAIVAMLAVEIARPSLFRDALQTFPETSAGYSVGGVLRWLVRTLAALDLATGAVPLVALVLLTVARRTRVERAFLAVTWACLAWFLVLGGLSGSWDPYGLKERYVYYLQPLLLLAFLLWVERDEPRRFRVALPAIGVLALAVAFLPLRELLTAGSLPGNALGMEVFRRLGDAIGFGAGLRALLIVAVIDLPILALLLWRRWALVGLMAVFLAVSAGFAARLADDQARAVARTAAMPADRSWVDDIAGKDANVVLLNTANFMPETARGDYFTVWAPWWETEFWNRSARTVYSLGSPEPIPLAHRDGALDWATGVVQGVPPAKLVLSDPRFVVAGGRLRATRAFVLSEPTAPLRLASATEGVFRDGESSPYAAYDRWIPGARRVRIEVGAGPVTLHIRVGQLVGGPAMGRVTDEITASGSVTVPVPPAPFRIEVRYGAGVRSTIRFAPLDSR